MFNNKKIIAIIPARGGSKGIPNKNIKLINNKPLIYYSIKEAKKSKYIDEIVVSTDSKKIAEISVKYGGKVPFLRPAYLAKDTSKTIECVIYTLNKLKEFNKIYDILVLLQPTSPLRTYVDIDKSIELFFKVNKSVLSINKIDINPLLYRTINNKNKLNKILNLSSTVRRQDLPEYYKVNGAIYINDIKKLNLDASFNDNEYGYLMDSKKSIDIDNINDLNKVKKILKIKKLKR